MGKISDKCTKFPLFFVFIYIHKMSDLMVKNMTTSGVSADSFPLVEFDNHPATDYPVNFTDRSSNFRLKIVIGLWFVRINL